MDQSIGMRGLSGRKRLTSRRKKPFRRRFKEFLRQFIAFMFSNVGIISLVVGYTIAGAFIFIAIEDGASKQLVANVNEFRNETCDWFWNVTNEMNLFAENEWRSQIDRKLLAYQDAFVQKVRDGYDGTSDPDSSKQWSFVGAFLYSLTVITTIGYGNISPRTEWGKIITILYAILGMPLFLLYLSNIGDVLARAFKWIYAKCCLCRGCTGVMRRRLERKRANNGGDDGGGGGGGSSSSSSDRQRDEDYFNYDPERVTVPITLCLAIMVGYVCGGAVLFSKWEDWNLLDGSYFCFISLSTIGFGDIVPGDKIYSSEGFELSFIFCAMYLFLGMALIAMCFNLMQEEVIVKIRLMVRTFRFLFRCRRGRSRTRKTHRVNHQHQHQHRHYYLYPDEHQQQQQQQQQLRPHSLHTVMTK